MPISVASSPSRGPHSNAGLRGCGGTHGQARIRPSCLAIGQRILAASLSRLEVRQLRLTTRFIAAGSCRFVGIDLTPTGALHHDGFGKRSLRQQLPWCPVSAHLTPYELRVLRSHRKRPLRESELEKRRAALLKLSRLGYLELRAGIYWITATGEEVLAVLDRWNSDRQ